MADLSHLTLQVLDQLSACAVLLRANDLRLDSGKSRSIVSTLGSRKGASVFADARGGQANSSMLCVRFHAVAMRRLSNAFL